MSEHTVDKKLFFQIRSDPSKGGNLQLMYAETKSAQSTENFFGPPKIAFFGERCNRMLFEWTLNIFALGQHCTTMGHYFSILPSAPVNICLLIGVDFFYQNRVRENFVIFHLIFTNICKQIFVCNNFFSDTVYLAYVKTFMIFKKQIPQTMSKTNIKVIHHTCISRLLYLVKSTFSFLRVATSIATMFKVGQITCQFTELESRPPRWDFA